MAENENATEQVATEEQQEPVNITVADLQALVNLIDVASSRGAFRGAELTAVGTLYTKLATFLQQVTNAQPADVSTEETVEAKAANKSEAKKLEIEEGTPVLSLHRLSSDKKGKAVEYSDLVIKSDMYKHKIMLFSDKVTNI